MRDPAPLVGDQRIGDHILTEVVAVKLQVEIAEGVRGEGFSLRRHLVGPALELLEHGLPEQRALEAFQVVVDQVRLLLFRGGAAQQVFQEQDLVGGGGDLRHEDRVVGIQQALGVAGIPGVHGVAHLVDEGEDIVQGAVVVEQHVGMHAVHAGGVGAGALALILRHVDPSLRVGLLHDVHILLAHRREGLEGQFFRLLVGDALVPVLDHGHVDVVHVQLVHAQQVLAQGHIAVHRRQAAAHAVDQAVAHGGGDVVRVHGRLKSGTVFPCPGVEELLLHLSLVEGRPGIREGLVPAVVFFKDLPAQGPVRVHLQRHEPPVGDGDLGAVRLRHGIEFQVRVHQHAEPVGRGLSHGVGGGEELLLLLVQHVGLAAHDLPDGDGVLIKPRLLGKEALPVRVRNIQQLRLEEGELFHDLVHRRAGPHVQGLPLPVPGILVVAHVGVARHVVKAVHALLVKIKKLQQGGGALEGPLHRGHLIREFQCFIQLLLPCRLVGADILQPPGELLGHLGALRQCFFHFYVLLMV